MNFLRENVYIFFSAGINFAANFSTFLYEKTT